MKRQAEPYRPPGPAHALVAGIALLGMGALAVAVLWVGLVLLLLVGGR